MIRLIDLASQRLLGDIQSHFPSIHSLALEWFKQLSASEHPEEYYKVLEAQPILLLPWWADEPFNGGEPDLEFHADLVYSTISIYYFIRILDNILDREQTIEEHLLPMLAFLHTQWQYTYHCPLSGAIQ